MPAYNAEDTITRSILSVWMQTHQNWKIIVLDDMSTDSTVKTVKGIKQMIGADDNKIKLIVNKTKKQQWYKEDLFARFHIISDSGKIET